MRFSKSVVFSPPFLRSSILQIYTGLRLFRLSFLYILFLTFIKGFLIKANTFRVLCGIKSIEYIKNDRALCAPSPIFLQLTIRFRPPFFTFLCLYRHLFLCFIVKAISRFSMQKSNSFLPRFQRKNASVLHLFSPPKR